MEALSRLVRFVIKNTRGVLVESIEVRPSRLVPELRKLEPWLCVVVNDGEVDLHFPSTPL